MYYETAAQYSGCCSIAPIWTVFILSWRYGPFSVFISFVLRFVDPRQEEAGSDKVQL